MTYMKISNTKRDKFRTLLKTIFQYQQDRISLDFGMYRVFRHKATEIERFLESELPTLVDAEAEKHGVTPEDSYNDILNFFARYYQDGDFYPVPQFGGAGAHILRHHGEEVIFSWANRDQYYIKSLTNFSEYRVRDVIPANLVWTEMGSLFFVVGDVEEVKGDQKKQRFFVLNVEKAIADQEGLRLVFDYITDKSAQTTAEALQTFLAEKEIELPLEVVADHLNRFTNLRKVDFFIHRRLGEFLREQLEFFVKTEVVRLTEPYTLKRALAVQAAAELVIDFLAKLEELQLRLWEMKKFAYGVGYIISLDRIAQNAGVAWLEKQVPLIIKMQKAEWSALKLGEYTKPADLRNGTAWKPLPVDTRLFENSFTWELLEALGQAGPLDGQLDGMVVNADNWQALNTLKARFRDRIKCFYIDPPYNTGSDGFPYKDGYPHSSWISMIEDRLKAAKPLMKNNGTIFVSIDDKEQRNLQFALGNAFGPQNRVEEIIWAQNTTKNQSPTYSTNHEYVEVYARSLEAVKKDERIFREPKPGYGEMMELIERLKPDYPPTADIEKEIKALFEQHIAELTEELEETDQEYEKGNDPWKAIFPYSNAEYRDLDNNVVSDAEARSKNAIIRVWSSADASMPSGKQAESTSDPNDPNYRFYKPINRLTDKLATHPKRGWGFPEKIDLSTPDRPSFEALDNKDMITWKTKVPRIKKYLHETSKQVAKSIVTDFTNGESELSNTVGKTNTFPNPKPTTLISRFILQTTDEGEWVSDFTLGSGTTAHAVAEAFHTDRLRRRFLGVELGEHFERTALPRIKRVFAAQKWKNGKPIAHNGIGLFMKVFKLTSYEEILENCTLKDEAHIDIATRLKQIEPFSSFTNLYRDEFLSVIPHMVEDKSPALLLNIQDDWLINPFTFTMKTLNDGRWQEQPIDLPETLSLLLGQEIERVSRFEFKGKRRLVVEGSGIVCYWREISFDEITEKYVKEDIALLKKNTVLDGRDLYINGIAQHHAKGWLPANAQETLYALRALLMQGVSA